MTNTDSRQKFIRRVENAMQLAERAETPEEAETARDRALMLIAKYGITDAERRSAAGKNGDTRVESAEFRITGRYVGEQIGLLAKIGFALHCSHIYSRRSGRFLLYGHPTNLDRARILFALVQRQMLAEVATVRPEWYSDTSTVLYRKSWMRLYADTIQFRLSRAERTATEQSQVPGTALVLASDADRAEAEVARLHAGRKTVKDPRNTDPDAAWRGHQAALRAQLDDPQLENRRALSR